MDQAADAPAESGSPGGDPLRWALGWRRALLATGMFVYPFVSFIGVTQFSKGAAAFTGYAIGLAFCVVYAMAAVAFAQHSERRFWPLLAVLTVLFAAELPFARTQAFYLLAVIVSFLALTHPRRLPLVLGGAVALTLLVPWAVRPWHTGPGWLEAAMVAFTALVVRGYADLAGANQALLEARAEVARLASDAERNRIARDLHDLLGHSLTAITVKSNLARRLAEGGADRAVAEITEVERLSRQALGEVRAAVSGYREVTLPGELARGRELLRAAGVTADLPSAVDVVDPAHRELFGWVVREGLTNVVRHARATRCTVTLSAAEVEIVDDGVGGASGPGSGLTGLRERVAAAGGRVESGPAEPRGWRLRVTAGTAGSHGAGSGGVS
ncbi:sensor histidine kinase [Actinomadura rupiterrae]|uniref:sensor histidine kinase n=1 Tax=Actinomadura rupiterrae TaxID=559627 RepID=UPI0020A4A8CE|nr:sensor histidine kinase [Actinomadura rupiterrae]MCP2343114.1 two-component system sensor histidine kinase DesK [Actinomadura rupiterrae]